MTQPDLDSRRKFAMIPEEMLFDPEIPGEAVKVFGVLHRYGSTPDKCYPSVPLIAERSGLNVRTVQRHVALLETKGWLKRVARYTPAGDHDSNGYQLFAQHAGGDTRDTTSGQESHQVVSGKSPPWCQESHQGGVTGVTQKRAIEREPLNETSSPQAATIIDINTREQRPPTATFDDFWQAWPRKVGKKDARKAWDKAIRAGADPAAIIAGARRLAANPPAKQFIKHPSGWINGERWDDEPDEPVSTPHQPYDWLDSMPNGGAVTATAEELGITELFGG